MTTSISGWYGYYPSPYVSSGSMTGVSGSNLSPPLQSYQTEISDLAALQSNLDGLLMQSQNLSTLQSQFSFSASSSASSVATATAGSGAISGIYNVQIGQLAQGQVVSSAAQSSATAAIGSGSPTTLTFQFANGNSKSVAIDGTDNTLQGISDAINGAQIGVSASVVSNGSGQQLALTGATGSANAFSVSVNGDATLSSMFNYSPGSSSNGLTLNLSAQDAQGSVNGVAFSSGSNAVTGATNGLTLNLVGTGTTTVNVSPDATAATSTIQSFVNVYNGAQSTLNALNQGDLSGSGILSPIQDALTNVVHSTSANGNGLSGIGITANADGTLSFDATAFQAAAVANPQNVTQLLSNTSGTGLGDQLSTVLDGFTSGGSLQSIMSSLQAQDSAEQMLGSLASTSPDLAGNSISGLPPDLAGASLYSEVQQLVQGTYSTANGLSGSTNDPSWSTLGTLSDAYSLLNNVYA
ncbi:MAG TPA: flagellar filament capping protein FliD [Aquabacterium sp.]|nr:flagellar filament capping protein FliD [Aquabacterium sp.]